VPGIDRLLIRFEQFHDANVDACDGTTFEIQDASLNDGIGSQLQVERLVLAVCGDVLDFDAAPRQRGRDLNPFRSQVEVPQERFRQLVAGNQMLIATVRVGS